MTSNFAVFGINAKDKNVGCLFVSDSRELAESKASEAARSGWFFVEVCDSEAALERWRRDAPEVLNDYSP